MKSEFEESDERFEAIFQQAAVGIAQLSPEGTWIRTNQKILRNSWVQ